MILLHPELSNLGLLVTDTITVMIDRIPFYLRVLMQVLNHLRPIFPTSVALLLEVEVCICRLYLRVTLHFDMTVCKWSSCTHHQCLRSSIFVTGHFGRDSSSL